MYWSLDTEASFFLSGYVWLSGKHKGKLPTVKTSDIFHAYKSLLQCSLTEADQNYIIVTKTPLLTRKLLFIL